MCGSTPGGPGLRRSNVHFKAINRRCHRMIVSGVTMLATSCSTLRPSAFPLTASRARWASVRRSLRLPNCCLSVRFLLQQVFDHSLLMPIGPASEDDCEEVEGLEDRCHGARILPVESCTPGPGRRTSLCTLRATIIDNGPSKRPSVEGSGDPIIDERSAEFLSDAPATALFNRLIRKARHR